MQIPVASVTDLDSFTTALTAKIESDLPAWYGRTARLLDAPTFQPRAWSYFFRYRVQITEKVTKAILVKIRHTETMAITEAMVHEKMKAEMRDEYDSLVNIQATFAQVDEASQFFTIRPLALYEDLNVLVMEEANIRPVKSFFQARAMWREGKARRAFETILERVGHWLRIFHDQVGETKIAGPLFEETWYRLTQERLARLTSGTARPEFRSAQIFIDAQFEKKQPAQIPYRTLHEDFNAVNVFVTPDGRICSFDPHNRPGPIYYDLAKLLTDLEMSRLQTFTLGLSVPATWLKKYRAALLRGYFNAEPFDESAMVLFNLLTLIERWDEAESNYHQATGRKKLIYILSMPLMRSYYARLLRQQLAQWI